MRHLILALVLFATSLYAAEEIPVGSELRKELFDSIRPQAEKLADQPIKFLGSMKQESGWAVFLGQIVDKKGKPINIGDAESSEAFGLWQKKNGAWKLIEFNAGFTDAFYVDYPESHGVPKALLVP
jgi:hypothetical protein